MKTNINLVGYVLASVFTPTTFFYAGLYGNWWDRKHILEVIVCFAVMGLLIFTLFIVWHLYAEHIETERSVNYREQVTEDLKLLDKYEKDFE